ncbi:MAG: DolP-mannose mannosyltransferase, partial [Candidatus Binatia bacterium]
MALLFWFCLGLFACYRFNPLQIPFAIDNQIYFFISERVAAGVPPHISLVDHKNSLSSLLSGAAIVAGRWLDVDDALSVRVLSGAVAAGTVVAVWLLAYRLRGRRLEAHLSALFMLVFVDYFAQGAQGVRPKVFMAFFMTAALASFARRRLLRSGVLSASSFLCWQPALLIPACLGLSSLIEPPRMRRALRFGLGAAGAVIAYELYFVWHGAIGEQLFQTYVMPTREEAWPVLPLRESLRFIVHLGHNRQDASMLLPVVFMGGIGLAGLLALLRPRTTWDVIRTQSAWAALVLSSATACGFTLVNHQAYPDLFFLHPLIAVAGGLAVGAAYDWFGRLTLPSPLAFIRPVLVALLVLTTAQLAWDRRSLFRRSNQGLSLDRQRALAEEVEDLSEEYGSVWAIGCVHLLALNRTGNFLPYGLLIDPNVRAYMMTKTGGKPFVPLDANGELPGLILVARGGERKIMPWLPRLFEKVENTRFKGQGVTL